MSSLANRFICMAILLLITSIVAGTNLNRNRRDLTDLVQRLRNTSQSLRDKCTCLDQLNCGCCARILNNDFDIDKNICANFTLIPETFSISTDLNLNGKTLYSNNLSANDLPPFCFTIPLPIPIPISSCFQLYSIQKHSNVLHACSSVSLSLLNFELLNFSLGCLDFSADGIKIVDDDHNDATANAGS